MKYNNIRNEIDQLEITIQKTLYRYSKTKERDRKKFYLCINTKLYLVALWEQAFNNLYDYRNKKIDWNRDPLYRKMEQLRDRFINLRC